MAKVITNAEFIAKRSNIIKEQRVAPYGSMYNKAHESAEKFFYGEDIHMGVPAEQGKKNYIPEELYQLVDRKGYEVYSDHIGHYTLDVVVSHTRERDPYDLGNTATVRTITPRSENPYYNRVITLYGSQFVSSSERGYVTTYPLYVAPNIQILDREVKEFVKACLDNGGEYTTVDKNGNTISVFVRDGSIEILGIL